MVSIIVAAYNVEKYIADCLESIFAQAWEDYELIVVDDGSTDSTPELCRQMLDGRANARYICQQNAGAGAARNAGMDAARGEFLMFVDGDDQVEPELIRRLMAQVGPRTDVAACCCIAFRDGMEPSPFHFFSESFTAANIEQKQRLYAQLIHLRNGQPDRRAYSGIGVPWGKLYRTSALDGLRFPDLRRMQDNIFNMYAFAAAREVVYLDEPLYRYRREHIAGYRVQPEVRVGVIEARERFFAAHPEHLTEAMRDEFYREKLRFFGNGLKYCAGAGGREALRKVRELCQWNVYRALVREPVRTKIEPRYRVALLLARLRLYAPLTWLSARMERKRAGR